MPGAPVETLLFKLDMTPFGPTTRCPSLYGRTFRVELKVQTALGVPWAPVVGATALWALS